MTRKHDPKDCKDDHCQECEIVEAAQALREAIKRQPPPTVAVRRKVAEAIKKSSVRQTG